MKKKILSLLTAMMVVMTMLPMNSAFADPQPMPQIIIGELEIEGLVKPVAGQKPQINGLTIKPGSAHADDYELKTKYDSGGTSLYPMMWWKWNKGIESWEIFYQVDSNGKADQSMENAVFEEGEIYQLTIDVLAKDGKAFKYPINTPLTKVILRDSAGTEFRSIINPQIKYTTLEDWRPCDPNFNFDEFWRNIEENKLITQKADIAFYWALGKEDVNHTVHFITDTDISIDPITVKHGQYLYNYFNLNDDDTKTKFGLVRKNSRKINESYVFDRWILKNSQNQEYVIKKDPGCDKAYVAWLPITEDVTFVAEWKKIERKNNIKVTLDDITVQYGDPINPKASVEGKKGNIRYSYKGIRETTYPQSSIAPKEVGTYQIKAIFENSKYRGSTTANLTITPKEVTITGAKAVDRSYQAGNVIVNIAQSGAEVQGHQGGDVVSVKYPPTGTMADANAGTNKTVTATFELDGEDKDNYVLKQQPSITVNITKADPTAVAPSNVTATVGQKLKEAVIGQAGTGDGAWTWNEPETVLNEAGVKSYPMTFTPSDATNYNTKSENVSVIVSKKTAPGDVNQEVRIKVGDTQIKTVDLSSFLPKDRGETTFEKGPVTDNDLILNGDVTVHDGVVSYQLKDTAQVGKQATIRLTARMANYEDAGIMLTILVTDKDVLVASVEDFSKVYDGEVINLDALTKKATFENKDVSGTWSWAGSSDPNAMKNAGTHSAKLIFTPTETDKYENAEATFSIMITKANSTGTPTFKKITEANKTLADADLQEGTLTPEGTVAWELPNTTKVEPNVEYKWVFTPDDATNYNGLSGKAVLYQLTSSSGNSGGGYSGGGQSSVRPDSSSSTKSNENKVEDKKQESKSEQKENKPSNAASEAKVKAVLKIGSTEYKANDNTETKSMDVAPMIREGRTMLPARMISELLGVNVNFNSATKTAKFIYTSQDGKENTIELTLGQPMMKVNGQNKALTAKVEQVQGRIILPLTDVQKALKELGLNIEVEWDAVNKEVIVK